jgi:hypothetical protein
MGSTLTRNISSCSCNRQTKREEKAGCWPATANARTTRNWPFFYYVDLFGSARVFLPLAMTRRCHSTQVCVANNTYRARLDKLLAHVLVSDLITWHKPASKAMKERRYKPISRLLLLDNGTLALLSLATSTCRPDQQRQSSGSCWHFRVDVPLESLLSTWLTFPISLKRATKSISENLPILNHKYIGSFFTHLQDSDTVS